MLLLKTKEPYSTPSFTQSVQALIPSGDTVAEVELSVEPSGPGELVVSNLSVDSTGLLVSWKESGGVPSRLYTLNLIGTSAGGVQFQLLFQQFCDAELAVFPPPVPTTDGFGTPISWSAAPATGPTVGIYDQSTYGNCVYG